MSEIFASPVFTLAAASLAILALAFVIWPLWSRGPAASALKRRRRALEALREDLGAEDYAERMTRLEREQAATGQRSRNRVGLSVLLIAGVPALALALYLQVGTPEGIAPDSGENAHARQMLGDLARRVREAPDDTEAWIRLGLIWKQMQQYPAAEAAFRRGLFIDPDNSFARVELAETLLFGSGETSLPGESRSLLESVLADDPVNQKALWLAGMGAFQDGNGQRAVELWTRLEGLLPDGSARDQVRERIAAATGGATDPQSARDAPPDGNARIRVEVALDPALAERVTGDETVFVFARAVDGPRAPLAVRRLPASELPASITLSDDDAMAEGLSLSGYPEVRIAARVSSSGDAIPAAGDLEGHSGPVTVGEAGDVAVTIDRVIE